LLKWLAPSRRLSRLDCFDVRDRSEYRMLRTHKWLGSRLGVMLSGSMSLLHDISFFVLEIVSKIKMNVPMVTYLIPWHRCCCCVRNINGAKAIIKVSVSKLISCQSIDHWNFMLDSRFEVLELRILDVGNTQTSVRRQLLQQWCPDCFCFSFTRMFTLVKEERLDSKAILAYIERRYSF